MNLNSMTESMDTALIPQITTWRFQGLSYIQQSSTNDSQRISVNIGPQLIEYMPSPPIPVQAGDIVGISLPSVDDDLLTIKPLFLNLSEENVSTISCAGLQSNSEVFFFDTVNQRCNSNAGEEEQSLYIPLISVNISKLPYYVT